MPEPDQDHGDDLGDQNDHPGLIATAAAHGARDGIKEVGTEPLREGHMPVVPELGQVRLEIRAHEIFGQSDPEDARHTDGDIGVA